MKAVTLFNHPKRRDIEERLKIMAFFDQFGAVATQAAFGKSRSTIFGWKRTLRQANGRLVALAPQSKAPKRRRVRNTNPLLVSFIKQYRIAHPGVGKETIKPELDEYCLSLGLTSISESTIGRIIKDLKSKGDILPTVKLSLLARTGRLVERSVKRRHKLRRHGYQPTNPGGLVQLDSITIFVNGLKRYLVTAIDLKTRFAFAQAYTSLTSANAKDFMAKFIQTAPFTIRHAQTDNGSEFEALFDQFLKDQGITHFWNYPRYPKGNAYIERFNGLIQSQYVSWHMEELTNPITFNVGLVDWLLWYNTKKQHSALGKLPPLRYFVDTFIQPLQSNMYWTETYA
jgi:transposase InsO family protein